MNKDTFWLNDYSVLYDKNKLFSYIPNRNMTNAEKLNSIVRLSVYVAVILVLLRKPLTVLLIPVFTAIATIFLHKYVTLQEVTNILGTGRDLEDIYDMEHCKKPSSENPFMNNLLGDQETAPQDPCLPTQEINQKSTDHFHEGLYRNVTDIYESENGQRQFYTAPGNFHGTNNGDTGEFAKWLFKTEREVLLNEDLRHASRNEILEDVLNLV